MAKGKRPTSDFNVAGPNVAGLGSKSSAKTGSSTKTRSSNAKEFKPSQKTGSDVHTGTPNPESH